MFKPRGGIVGELAGDPFFRPLERTVVSTSRKHFIIAIAAFTPMAASAQTMFRGGADHVGVYQSPAPSLATVAWKFNTQGRVVSSPVVGGDAVYFGSSDNNLYAVSRADGSPRWKFATKGAVNSSPAFAEGVVYVNSNDGQFYAVDAATGKEKWHFKTAGERRFTAPATDTRRRDRHHHETSSVQMRPSA
jgi:hypothetical protein